MKAQFKFCPACGAQNRIGAKFCQQCSAFIMQYKPVEKNTIGPLLLTALGAIGFVGLLVAVTVIRSDKDTNPLVARSATSPGPTSMLAPTPDLPPAEHLAEAKKEMKEVYCKFGCQLAARHLEAIPSGAKEYKEAVRLLGVLKQRFAQGEATSRREEEKRAALGRSTYADQVERNFLSNGMDATVRVSGSENRTIKITYVLFSRPVIYKMVNEENFLEKMQAEGFNKVIFYDGYNWSWWYTYDEKAGYWK